MNASDIKNDIITLKGMWGKRNDRFRDWYRTLKLIDTLYTKNMESYVDNHPRTFFNAAHYLLTMGEISHNIPIVGDSALEQDKRAKVNRACEYMWKMLDDKRKMGGSPSFINTIGFDMLALGWYATVFTFDKDTGLLNHAVWSPADTYPRYEDGMLTTVVFEYSMADLSLETKARYMGCEWQRGVSYFAGGQSIVHNYFFLVDVDNDIYGNVVLINGRPVTNIILRDNIKLMVSPVGGFPDRGSIDKTGATDWTQFIGQSILETGMGTNLSGNKWMSFLMQILRDTAQAKYQEFSGTPVATTEQVRTRGSLFHYASGEAGLQPVPQNPIPLELSNLLSVLDKSQQKATFSDVVFGMAERGMPGYVLSQLATTSANQMLYPYMQAKHFLLSEADKFWLGKLKTSRRVFEVKGKMVEKLQPTDIPEDVDVVVESDVATPKDWMERGTIAGLVKDHLDEDSILSEVFKITDTQGVKRRKNIDDMRQNPMTKNIELITAYENHADYLEHRGDIRGATRFRQAAKAMEAQLGVPPAGSAKPTQATQAEAGRSAASPEEVSRVNPSISPPEARRGMTPQQVRNLI